MYQVTSVCFSDTAEQVISGGIDNDVKVRLFIKLIEDLILQLTDMQAGSCCQLIINFGYRPIIECRFHWHTF